MAEEYIYIVNPKAGKLSIAKKKKIIASITPGSNPTIIFSKSLKDASLRAHEFFSQDYFVVACGGDGFVNTIAQKAIECGGRMGVLPFGRGNDFARSLNLDKLEQAILAIKNGKFEKARYLRVETKEGKRIALTNAGAGLLSEAAYRASRIPILKGSLLYVVAALLSFINLKCHNYTFTYSKKEISMDALIIAVAVSQYTGGGMFIAPEAHKFRDKLNLLYASKLSRLKAVSLLIKVFSGTHILHESVTNKHVERISIKTNSSNKWSSIVSGDGEYLGSLPAKISLGKDPLYVAR